jgi:hypothetical protein
MREVERLSLLSLLGSISLTVVVGEYVCAGICPNGKRVSGGLDGGIRISDSECSMAVPAMFEANCGSGYPPASGSSSLKIFAYGPFQNSTYAEKFRDSFITPMNNLFAQTEDSITTPLSPYSRYPSECVGPGRRDVVEVSVGLQTQMSQASCGCGDFVKTMLLVRRAKSCTCPCGGTNFDEHYDRRVLA